MKVIKKFVLNALLLTCVSLFMRTVSVSFNVYVSNKIGAEAMGLFSLISSVYGFALTLSTSGINLATTRMVAEALGKKSHGLVRLSMKKCLAYALSFSVFAAVALFFSARFIGTSLLCDTRTITSLRLLALSLPPIAFSSSMNGYFTAVRRVYKNACVQLYEQAVKIALTVFLLSLLLPSGIEYACIALVLGGAVGEVASFLFLLLLYVYDKRHHIEKSASPESGSVVRKRLLGISLPVAFSAYMRSALITVEHILIPIGLRKNGASRERSLAAYGTLHSMVLPVVLFPSAILSSFSSLLIPEMTEYAAGKRSNGIRYAASRAFQMTLIFSVGIAGIMLCFASSLGSVIYSNEVSGEVALYIRMLSPLIPVMYLDSVVDAMLKGLGQQVYSMNVNIADALLSVLLVWILLPRIGIIGYVITIYFSELFNAVLSIIKLLAVSDMKPKSFVWIILPFLSIMLSAGCVRVVSSLTVLPITPAAALTVNITATILLYVLFLILFKAVSRDDLKWLAGIFRSSGVATAIRSDAEKSRSVR